MRIILADHHAPALRALKQMLQDLPEYELAGEAVDAKSLLSLAREQGVDLVLVDWELPGATIEDLIAELHTHVPRPTVIVMSAHDEYGRRPLRAGADAFVSKRDEPQWLMDTLRTYAGRTRN